MKNETLKTYLKKQKLKDYIRTFSFFVKYFILFIKKSNDTLRPCINYKKLNEVVIKNRYLISLYEKQFNEIIKAREYTQLNLRNAFNLIRIKEENK